MPKRTSASSREPKKAPELVVTRHEADSRLHERIKIGLELKQRDIGTRAALDECTKDYRKWNSFNAELLKRIFTTDDLASEYSYFAGASIVWNGQSLADEIAELHGDIDMKVHRLESIAERLELIPQSKEASVTTPAGSSAPAEIRTKKVFVVHGRDEISKASLEILLNELGLEPVVLHRQADQGMTIIEKFEKHSDVGYAFIVLTPDEIAYLTPEDTKPDAERVKEFRARPNVIFEFGYFVGKLGRSRVCCLYTGNVSLPSDVSGMIYKRYTSNVEEVAYSIAKDLRAAGYTFD